MANPYPIRHAAAALAGALALAYASAASAVMVFNTDVTPDVIFGTGNANGAFTVDRSGGIELGLRTKLRFDAANQPQNVFNYQGNIGDVGIYKFTTGAPGGSGFGFAPNSPSTASWNFEWSINTDFDGTSGLLLDDLTYELGIDFDSGAGTNFLTFDLINQPFADHAIGNNGTGNGGGTSAADAPGYAALIAANNVAQNSWNMEFFDNAMGGFPFVGGQAGSYDIYLAALRGGQEVARTQIQVHVPEPATGLLIGAGLLGVAARLRRRRG